MKVRTCSVAGQFYPGEPSHLEQLLEGFFRKAANGRNARGIVSPHAGYIYSGKTAARAFTAIDPAFDGTFLVIGPSHRGFLTCASAVDWETPLGIVENDPEFVDRLEVEVDEVSHRGEHSLEVQMPFIRYRFPRCRVVPVMMGDQSPASAVHLAGRILEAVHRTGRNVRIVASSDFSHYVPDAQARRDDLAAIGPLLTLDTDGFYRKVQELGVSACGYGPIATMVMATKGLGARKAELLQYTTSGDITGDHGQVVGYAAIAVI
ncbi:MAG: AmmeMemoRadiSam system protein B [Methanomicrobiales archaeon]|nr:AmmeMemoRadiSam system protein B [Methanomicrobiales archaeon]